MGTSANTLSQCREVKIITYKPIKMGTYTCYTCLLTNQYPY